MADTGTHVGTSSTRVMILPVTERFVSLPVWVTSGCPNQTCKFCLFNKARRFAVRPLEEARTDLKMDAQAALGWGALMTRQNGGLERATSVTSIFLTDEDSMGMNPGQFLQVLAMAREELPNLQRVATYASVRSILARKEALEQLREAGLTDVYVGFESGLDDVLTWNEKKATVADNIAAGIALKEAGISIWAMNVVGLAGEARWEDNAAATAAMLNQFAPDNVMLTMLTPSCEYEQLIAAGGFKPSSEEQLVLEALMLMRTLRFEAKKYVIANNVACCGDYKVLDAHGIIGELETMLGRVRGGEHLVHMYGDCM